MKKILVSVTFFLAFSLSAQTNLYKFFEGKTFEGRTGFMCAEPPADAKGGCYGATYYLDISFASKTYVAKRINWSCGNSAVISSQKGTWKMNGSKIVFTPKIRDNQNDIWEFKINSKSLVGSKGDNEGKFILKK